MTNLFIGAVAIIILLVVVLVVVSRPKKKASSDPMTVYKESLGPIPKKDSEVVDSINRRYGGKV